jgi:hypothetical protein
MCAAWCRFDRDHAEKVRGITAPEVVAGTTAHPALDKACHYLKARRLPPLLSSC